MRWLGFSAAAALGWGVLAGCGNTTEDGSSKEPIPFTGGPSNEELRSDEPCNEPYEFAYLSYARKGDYRRGQGGSKSVYLLLYTSGWMKTRTWGGPFEPITRREGITTSWKHIKKNTTQSLYSYFFTRGFFDLPGSDLVDWARFKADGYWTKAISVDREGDRRIVYLEDVTGAQGTDPRWNTFNDCEKALLEYFNRIEDVKPVVQKSSFSDALDAYMKGK
jgi:hypothetical protein